ncbi:hypothetical protein ABZ934_31285 [Streptomyces sp. NPDC046557]|uniref:hypothetical protein n=1 Tax=Streptomyces sp. NPDC046557 TaxID=3155372 RepID=UPI0033EA8729
MFSRTAKVHETVGDHRTAAEHYAPAATGCPGGHVATPPGVEAGIAAADLTADTVPDDA